MENTIIDQDQMADGHHQEPVYATFWERVGASFIDGLIMIPVVGFTFYNMLSLKSVPLMIVCALIPTVYKVYLEGRSGATIGKRSMKIVVRNAQGETIGMPLSLRRNMLYIITAVVGMIDNLMVFSAEGFSDIRSMGELGAFQNVYGLPFGFLPSLVIFISVLFVAFDKHKQALHDKIGGTYCCIR